VRHVDQGSAYLRVLIGQQSRERHLDEGRVAVVRVAICECQLHGLGDEMDVVG